jgi:Mn2+/Fe2+ NRAMP family transporter
LPLVAVFLWVAVTDRDLLGEGANTRTQNVVMGVVVLVCVVLGLRGLLAAIRGALAFLG